MTRRFAAIVAAQLVALAFVFSLGVTFSAWLDER